MRPALFSALRVGRAAGPGLWSPTARGPAPARRGFAALLNAAQVAAYQRDGYLIPDFKLSEERLAAGSRAMDELLASNPHVMPELLVNAHLKGGEGEAEGVRGSDEFLALASMPALVDLVAQCLGTENVILWACQIFCKLPGTGKSVPFHQDGQYWPIVPLRACTCWISLDGSDAENGALQVIPGSHLAGSLEHVQRIDEEACINYVAEPGLVAPMRERAVTMELEPGRVSLHDSMVVHGSERNHSSRRRAGIAATYMPAESLFDRQLETEGAKKGGIKLDFSKRPLFLVKGSNQHPGNEPLHRLC